MEGNKFHDPDTPPAIDLGQFSPTSDENVSQTSEKTLGDSQPRRTSHTEQALHLVDTVTRNNNRRRPSRGGILSNLLKLDLFEEKQRRHKGGKSPQQGTKTPTKQPVRPQLKSIASSRALLQTIGASPSSARNSMYFEDLHKAEMGMAHDVDVAAHRLAIASEIADILQRQDLIIKMGKCLVRTGAPSHRIVSVLFLFIYYR